MKEIKIVVALLVVSLILPVMGQMSTQEQKHIIEGVPFVGHDPEWPYGCWLYASQMVLGYIDINITVPEYIYYIGLTKFGYRAPPSPLRIPEEEKGFPSFTLYPLRMSQDYPFGERLYGLESINWFANKTNPYAPLSEKEWNAYWNKVKEYILQDIPVVTFVNPGILHGHSEGPGAHYVVIVGFDEGEGLVYYNDPASTIALPSQLYGVDDWEYVPVSISDLKRAVNGCARYKGQVWTFQKVEEPMELEERLKRGRKRELLRIRGDPTVYPGKDWTVGVDGSVGIYGLRAFKEGIDDAWEGWEEWNETERATMKMYVSQQYSFFQERAHVNGKCSEYLESVGADEAEIYAQFGKGCGHIAEKLSRIKSILNVEKLSERQISQVNSDLEDIEEEASNLIALWEELWVTLSKSLGVQGQTLLEDQTTTGSLVNSLSLVAPELVTTAMSSMHTSNLPCRYMAGSMLKVIPSSRRSFPSIAQIF